mmetsp:Transcript_10187/g.16537  ORF Transcript_10187/g.16537 Transcript_10187/m.16537 type:complete len:861 (-) Transcript_10187:55-2637(-)
MACLHIFCALLSFNFVAARRISDRHAKSVAAEAISETLLLDRDKYPKCSKRLDESGLQLSDLKMSREEVAKIIEHYLPGNCSWWASQECAEARADETVREYFLRMTLVGQADPRGPTLYTPKAQMAVVTAMRTLLREKLAEGMTNPDLAIMERVFRQIDVEDTGSAKIELINAFAKIFNRGAADSVYRSKDVRTRLYNLSTWGDRMHEKIPEYNDLKYENKNGSVSKALQLSYWYGLGMHSFVYKFPHGGIEKALQEKILDPFASRSSTMNQVTNMVAFEMAERWIRNFVILHPYTDSNGRTARVGLNIMLMLNGLVPMVMEKQDEDMTSSMDELRDKVCDGMVYARTILNELPKLRTQILEQASGSTAQYPVQAKDARCCAAADSLNGGEEVCVSVPMGLTCEKYGDLKQSMKYVPWKDSTSCGNYLRLMGLCSDKATRAKHIFEDTLVQRTIIGTAKAGSATKLYRMTAYRSQSFSYPKVGNCNLASDIGELVRMANSGDERVLGDDNEIVVKTDLMLKIAEDQELAAQHYIPFKDGAVDKDRSCASCLKDIDTVGVERTEKHMWVSLPESLKCGEKANPGGECAWKELKNVKAIHAACLMGTSEEDGEKRAFEQIYKKFTYPKHGGEAALDEISKTILKLYRKAFDKCENAWPEAMVPVDATKDPGTEARCCCFTGETSWYASGMPDWVTNGVCLRDVGERTIFADKWVMLKVPDAYLDGATDCTAYEGMVPYRVDPKLGRCLSEQEDYTTSVTFNHYDANLGGHDDDVTFVHANPTLRHTRYPLAKYWKNHTYVCNSDIGMNDEGCDCSWVGDSCDKSEASEDDGGLTPGLRDLSGRSALPSMLLALLLTFAITRQ